MTTEERAKIQEHIDKAMNTALDALPDDERDEESPQYLLSSAVLDLVVAIGKILDDICPK